MRILMKDSSDSTLFVVEASEVNYDPNDWVIELCTSYGWFEVKNIDPVTAPNVMRSLYRDGRIDLSEYESEFTGFDSD